METSALLLDLDGVLIDSAASIEQEWRVWAAEHGIAVPAVLAVAHGRRAVDTIKLVAPHLDADAELASFLREPRSGSRCAAFVGARELVTALGGARWAVVTSSPRAMALEQLVRSGLPIPPAMVCAEDVARGKPSPDAYVEAARRLDVAANDCLVVEDAPAGVDAARAAGMRVVAVASTHAPARLAAADVVTRSIAAITVVRATRRIELTVDEL